MRKSVLVLIMVLIIGLCICAEEGMWLLTQLKDLNLKGRGFQVSPDQIYSPGRPGIAQAVVLLGGGTAELVSPEGLILTNHHVAFTAVQRASAKLKETDLIQTGFLAGTREEEIEAPGYSANILEDMNDITGDFLNFQKITDPEKRRKAIDRHIQARTDGIEKDSTDIFAQISEMYSGKQYILYVYRRYDDVRVVYVPPGSIGNFGGDIDNWMWPRHTGDFSFLRIYLAPDGTGRKFHKENIPYRSKYWLKVASKGLEDNDLTFIIGYPGNTTRYRTSHSVDYNFNYSYPRNIKLYQETIGILESFTRDSVNARMKVANFSKGLNNSLKNYQGQVECMKKSGFLDKKIRFENQLTSFLKTDSKLQKKYGQVLGDIQALYKEQIKKRNHDDALVLLDRLSGDMVSIAKKIYTLSREREKSLKERDPYFSEKDIHREADRLHFRYISFYEPADKALLKRSLNLMAKLDDSKRIQGLDYILKNDSFSIDQFIEGAYARTRLKDVNFVKTLYNLSSKEIESLNDPLLDLARQLYPEIEAARKWDETFGARITDLRRKYLEALVAWKGAGLYPDANRTIRFTFGPVAGYSPRDAVEYAPFSAIRGILEKETGAEPFEVPEKLKELYQKKDFGRWVDPDLNDVPVAFLHSCDITGGNSGSPVLNTRGELVGIAFDGNYEAMNSDWQFDENLQRTISVDIRYVMFITEKFAGAAHILKEMGLE
jgi:hypothetical protein